MNTNTDEKGRYLSKYKIALRGPPGSSTYMNPRMAYIILAHELKHMIFTSSQHSKYYSDLSHNLPKSRALVYGIWNTGSEKENTTENWLYVAERNIKPMDYRARVN